jgi:hypothetical protein
MTAHRKSCEELVASRKGIEPLTPGLGRAMSDCQIGSTQFKGVHAGSRKYTEGVRRRFLNGRELACTGLNGSGAAKL